jgi:hypothetical protein
MLPAMAVERKADFQPCITIQCITLRQDALIGRVIMVFAYFHLPLAPFAEGDSGEVYCTITSQNKILSHGIIVQIQHQS